MKFMDSQCLPPEEYVLNVFWDASRQQLGSARWENLAGPRVNSSLRPPAVQLDDDRQRATILATAVKNGELTRLGTPLAHIPAGDLPQPGDLLIVCDGDGMPLALVNTVSVEKDGDELVEQFVCLFPPEEKSSVKKESPDGN